MQGTGLMKDIAIAIKQKAKAGFNSISDWSTFAVEPISDWLKPLKEKAPDSVDSYNQISSDLIKSEVEESYSR